MDKAARIISVAGAAAALFVTVVVAMLAFTCTPLVVNAVIEWSQPTNDEVRAIRLEARQQIADVTLRYVTTGSEVDTMVALYRVDGDVGLDEIAHLYDVREIFAATWTAGIIAACVVLGAFTYQWRKGWKREQRRSLMIAGGLCIALPLVLGISAAFAFTMAFEFFHRLFFADGTWTFPSNSLLIQTFPEPFWMYISAMWMALVVICGIVLVVTTYVGARFSATR